MQLILSSSRRPVAFIFFVNRLTKIFFLYWIALILYAIVKPFPFNGHLFNSIFLVPGKDMVLAMAWTLSYELYFYFLIGSAAYLLSRKYFTPFLLFMLVASALVTFLQLGLSIHIKGTSFVLGRFAFDFFLGVASALLSDTISKSFRTGFIVFIIIASFFFLFLIPVPVFVGSLLSVFYGILSFSLVSFVTAFEKKQGIPPGIAAPVIVLGDASYAIYLLGPLVAFLIPGRDPLAKTCIVCATIIVSIFFNRVVEVNGLARLRPLLYRLGDQRWLAISKFKSVYFKSKRWLR